MIRGCIARKLNRMTGKPDKLEIEQNSPANDEKAATETHPPFQHLRRSFSKIRISHAFPSAECLIRPVRPPLSLIKTDRLYDAALLGSPVLIDGRAPAFDIDWKDDGDVKALFGWPGLRRELRVRTAIDPEKKRYKEKALFAYEMIVPKNHCWLARVYAGGVERENRAAVLDDLAALFENGLLGLGKSKVAVRAGIQQPGTVKSKFATGRVNQKLGVDGLLVITLQTPALMPDPRPLRKLNDSATLFEAYSNAWAGLGSSPKPALKLERFFARQFLSGGRYQHGRFQEKGAYQPWLLTDGGSVFVFSVTDAGLADETVQGWLKGGLPLTPKVLEAYGLEEEGKGDQANLWRRCPFIRQNGYGEIAVNLEAHEDKCPFPSQCKPITRLPDEEVHRE